MLSDGAAGAVVYDATRQLPAVKHATVGDLLIFRVARGCGAGAQVTWTPPSAAHPDSPFRHSAQEGIQIGPFLDVLTADRGTPPVTTEPEDPDHTHDQDLPL